jgi:hypothetical protein
MENYYHGVNIMTNIIKKLTFVCIAAELLAGNLYAPNVMIRFATVHYYKTLDLIFYYIVNAFPEK